MVLRAIIDYFGVGGIPAMGDFSFEWALPGHHLGAGRHLDQRVIS
jgi:hypothetical protein